MAPSVTSGGLATIVGALTRAAGTEDGKPVVAAHDEDYEVTVLGEAAVVVRMRGGDLELVDVSEGEPGFCSYTRVDFDPAAVRALAENAVTPTEATDSGAILMRSRLYGGGQFCQLLRIAQKQGLFES
jgi:hypothetical protein